MGKAVLEFKLPDEKDEFTLARRGADYYCILVDIVNLIRSHNKHGKKLGECWNDLEDIMNEFDMDEVS
jgi:hypothetical protein